MPAIVQWDEITLSGAASPRLDLADAAGARITRVLASALADAGIAPLDAAPAPGPSVALLAERVLPEAASGSALATAADAANWGVGPLADTRAPSLVVVHHVRVRTSAHRLAELGLGLAFSAPSLPSGGEEATYAGLIAPETGRLVWVMAFDGERAATETSAEAIADRIVARLAEDGL
ncbi:MAG: hypothetical protein AAGH87_00905 [Pseudomonadota bacterium]